jgi:hypothetical protein
VVRLGSTATQRFQVEKSLPVGKGVLSMGSQIGITVIPWRLTIHHAVFMATARFVKSGISRFSIGVCIGKESLIDFSVLRR